MQFSKLVLALLPALAVAQEAPAPESSTTTRTSTTVLYKTYFLSQVHTVTAVANNSTSTFLSTEVSTVETTTATEEATVTTAEPTIIPSVVPPSAGSALEAGKFAVAGIVGMVIVALM